MTWNGLRTTWKRFIIMVVLINRKLHRKTIYFFLPSFLLFFLSYDNFKPINQIMFWFQKVLIANPATKAMRFQRSWCISFLIEPVTRRCSMKKVFLNLAKFSEKYPCQSLLFNKVEGLRLQHRCFPVNIAASLRKVFL